MRAREALLACLEKKRGNTGVVVLGSFFPFFFFIFLIPHVSIRECTCTIAYVYPTFSF